MGYSSLDVIVDALANTSGTSESHLAKEGLHIDEEDHMKAILELSSCKISHFMINDEGFHSDLEKGIILSGSFNPLHEGHKQLLNAAVHTAGDNGILFNYAAFEISIYNADKPQLSVETISERISQFAGISAVLVTNKAPIFTQKAKLFPNSVFVIGYDTAIRILHKKYYENSEEKMVEELQGMMRLGCKFLVAGRINAEEEYCTLQGVEVPVALKELFISIPSFRVDISSTELRSRILKEKSSI